MTLTRAVLLFILGFFAKKAVDNEMKKLFENIHKYEFKTIQKLK